MEAYTKTNREITIGNTIYTVVSIDDKDATDMAYQKVKEMLLRKTATKLAVSQPS